jgi:K+/H+ antiporter YhaU regulatory subunit KhtT
MEKDLEFAMRNLLQMDAKKRWTLSQLENSAFIQKAYQELSGSLLAAVASSEEEAEARRYLHKFVPMLPPPAAFVASMRAAAKGTVGKTLGELAIGKVCHATVLLLTGENERMIKCPDAQTKLQKGDWVYLGVPSSSAVGSQEKILRETFFPASRQDSTSTVSEQGEFVKVMCEFDCFRFPEHIGKEVELIKLNLRGTFGINLAGIVSVPEGTTDKTANWFPSAECKVQPGDLGLVLRRPDPDGSSKPIMTDDDLKPLMDATIFTKRMATEKGA